MSIDAIRKTYTKGLSGKINEAAKLPNSNSNCNLSAPNMHFGFSTLAIYIQYCCMYWIAYYMKVGESWRNGTAGFVSNITYHWIVFYALSLDMYVTDFGKFLRNFPTLLQILTHSTMLLEGFLPIVILFPFFRSWVKLIMIFLISGLHIGLLFIEISYLILGFGLCLEIGMFPLIPPIGCILFIPSMCWNKLESYLEHYLSRTNRSPSISVYYNGGMKIELLAFNLRIKDRTLHRIVSPMLHFTERNENLSIIHESRY